MKTICVAVLLAAGTSAFAQAPEAPGGGGPAPIRPQLLPAPREKIQVQGTSERERRESTASKIVVPHEEVVKYGDTNVLDVLKRQPGITVRNNDVQMRGLGSGYTQVLVNGERVPPGFTLDALQPDLIERIEIVRGATAEYSTQGVAGTINIVLRRTVEQARRDLKLGAATQNDAISSNAFGQFADRWGNLSFTLPFGINRFAFANETHYEVRALDPTGATTTQWYATDNAGKGHGTNGNFSPRLLWNFEPGHSLAWESFVVGGRFWSRFGDASTILVPPPPPVTSTNVEAHSSFLSGRSNLTWNRGLGDLGRLEVKLGANFGSRDADSDNRGYDLAGAPVLRRYAKATFDENGVVFTGKHVMSILDDHSFVSGWDGGISGRKEKRLLDQSNPAAGTGTVSDERYDSRISRMALFAQDEWDVSAQLSAYAGLRWESVLTRSEGNTFEASENRASVASPILQGLWRIPGSKKDQLRAGLARTFRAPNPFELIPRRFYAANNAPTTPDYAGNASLKPELSWGLDAAYEHYPDAGGVASLSAYVRRIDDAFVREVVFEDGGWVSRPANGGQAVARGIEVDLKVNLRHIWKDAPSVDLRANGGINRSHVDSVPGPDNRLAQQTPWSFNAGFDQRLASLPLTIGASYHASAGGPVRVSQAQYAWSSVTRSLEAYALWRLSPATQLRFTASQLFTGDEVAHNTFVTAGGIQQRETVSKRWPRLAVLLELKL